MKILIFVFSVVFLSCGSADKNITQKKLNCGVLNKSNAMVCCLQFMSSKSGNDSKDAICRPLVDELVNELRQDRIKRKYLFCKSAENFQNCIDKLSTR